MSLEKSVGLLGASGFIGTAIRSRAEGLGMEVVSVPAPRLRVEWGLDPLAAAADWWSDNPGVVSSLAERLMAVGSLVNAAGLATPQSSFRSAELWGANAVLPALVCRLAEYAGVPQVIQVSSAAVQGRLNPLDERAYRAPLTPYALSKAAGEVAVEQWNDCLNAVIYRATSVQGPGRRMTNQILWASRMPVVPIVGRTGPILPLALIDNVAAAIVHLVARQHVSGIVLQPSEGISTRSLFELLGARRIISVREGLITWPLWVFERTGKQCPRAIAYARRLELLVNGQAIEANALVSTGFQNPVGSGGYRKLVS